MGVNSELLRPLKRHPIYYKVEDQHLAFGIANSKSIRNKADEFLHTYLEENLDCCVICETWLRETDQNIINLLEGDTRKLLTVNRTNRTGGGIALLVDKAYSPQQVEKRNIFTSFEYALWSIKAKNTTIYILGIYRTPYSEAHPIGIATFFDEFPDFLAELLADYKDIIIGSDFNIHMEDKSDYECQVFDDILDTYDMYQHVKEPTHEKGHLLDLIINSCQSEILLNRPENIHKLSDHWIVKCNINVNKLKPVRKLIEKREITKIDKCQLRSKLETMVSYSEELDDMELPTYYNNKLAQVIDEVAPIKEKFVTETSRPKWFTEETRHLKTTLRKIERRYRKDKTPQNKELFMDYKRSYRKHLKINRAKYINYRFDECGNDQKKLFATLEELTFKKSENPLPPGKTDKELSDLFCKFFYDKIEKIRNDFRDSEDYHPPDRQVTNKLMNFQELSEDEVLKIFNSMKLTNCSTDPCPSSIIKDNLDILLPLLTRIINNSLLNGTFVEEWKISTITPLIKKVGSTETSNYRPINNLSFLSKAIEKCIVNQFNEHCNKNELYPEYLSAYRADHSTETILLKLLNDVLVNMDHQKITSLVSCDLSAAFDTVNHSILLEVLEKYFGVQEMALKWFANYLENRKCQVQVGKSVSEQRSVNCSVPQGSCCGPTLFNAYASTLDHEITDIGKLGYADDHGLYDSFKAGNIDEEHGCLDNLSHKVNETREWMKANKLKMNDTKTEAILFGGKIQIKKCETDSITVGEVSIPFQSSIKYLGATLDNEMSFKQHIINKCKTASFNLYKIKLVSPYCSKTNLVKLVLALILSHFDYANCLFYGLPAKTLKPMQLIQNQAARLILKRRRYESAKQCLLELHWLPIYYRIQFKCLCLCFNIHTGKAPAYLQEMLKRKQPSRLLRSNYCGPLFEVPRYTCTTFGGRAFKNYAPRIWNDLPQYIREAENYQNLKKDLKTYLFTQAFSDL